MTLGLVTAPARAQDATGSKDHPLISRYEGSTIVKYERKAFKDYMLALGTQRSGTDAQGRSTIDLAKSQRVAGQLTRITYLAPEGRSALEIFRNYEEALESAHFEILYSCVEKACGQRFASAAFPLKEQELPGSLGTAGIEEQHYLSAVRPGLKGEVYVAVYVYFDKARILPTGQGREAPKAMLTQLDVIEVQPMEGGKVRVDAALMAKEIARAGHVALYEIYFDTDKAVVKPESEPTLAEIAKFLKANPEIKVFVVGHTDSTGGFEHNLDLSKRRAAAVVNELVRRHKVGPGRLQSHGVGLLAPVATNDTEEGRARNRRVELVKW
jgi:outer membrane protein OmpA-like peptidoglycan-associated protein